MSSTSTSRRESHAVLYSSAFSELIFHAEQRLIVATWKENSKKLIEAGVISELSRLLDYIMIEKPLFVVVDTSHYPFADNDRIQRWINTSYVPQLMESTVEKYALVVPNIPAGEQPDTDHDIRPRLEYFTTIDSALNWLK